MAKSDDTHSPYLLRPDRSVRYPTQLNNEAAVRYFSRCSVRHQTDGLSACWDT
ncbi:hypothetical protein ACFOEY_15460 [Paracandidimonas soli]|uniref:hypothetical protein n=1 Tax=Paracandidimonas soli TaxID=1917182 RepID=UPI0036178C72